MYHRFVNIVSCNTTIISRVRSDESLVTGFRVKIVLLSQATGSVSSGNLSAFDVICSKAREIVSETTGDAWLLILLPMETR